MGSPVLFFQLFWFMDTLSRTEVIAQAEFQLGQWAHTSLPPSLEAPRLHAIQHVVLVCSDNTFFWSSECASDESAGTQTVSPTPRANSACQLREGPQRRSGRVRACRGLAFKGIRIITDAGTIVATAIGRTSLRPNQNCRRKSLGVPASPC